MKIIHVIVTLCWIIAKTFTEKIKYIITEHPVITGYNKEHLRFVNITSQRYGRNDPYYYVAVHFDIFYEFHNNITFNFYFYEFLSNAYKRGFVEMHWKTCDLVHKDKFFGTALKQGKLTRPCPFPAGEYHLYNMTIPLAQVPRNFPFTKGRIYGNVTGTYNNLYIASGYIDMEIKEKTIRRRKPLM